MISIRIEKKAISHVENKIIENILFEDNFEMHNTGYKPKKPWELVEDEGNVIVTDEIIGALGTNKSVKIIHVKNSKTYLYLNFGEYEKIILNYFLRIEKFDDSGHGAAFWICNTSGDKNAISPDNQAVWMSIDQRKLQYYDQAVKTICEIEEKRWYHIKLYVNCTNKKYILIVNNKEISADFRSPHNIVDSIVTDHWKITDDWVTHIDEVKIELE